MNDIQKKGLNLQFIRRKRAHSERDLNITHESIVAINKSSTIQINRIAVERKDSQQAASRIIIG